MNQSGICIAPEVSLEAMKDGYHGLVLSGLVHEQNVAAEVKRVALLTSILQFDCMNLSNLHYILNLPRILRLARREPSLDELVRFYPGLMNFSFGSKYTYSVPTISELDHLKAFFLTTASCSVAVWLKHTFDVSYANGLAKGWHTLDSQFLSAGLIDTHPSNWTLDHFDDYSI